MVKIMNITQYTGDILRLRPSDISKAPAQTQPAVSPAWTVETEDIVSLAAFLLALVFLIFLGIGWLKDKAMAEQFIYAGMGTAAAFTSMIIGVIKATQEEKTGNKNNSLVVLQWIFIIVAIAVGTLALYRSFV